MSVKLPKPRKLDLSAAECAVLKYLLVDATSGWGEPLKDLEVDYNDEDADPSERGPFDWEAAGRALKSLARKMGVKS